MSPVTWLARKEGRILSSVHMGNLIPVTEMKNVLKAQNTRGPTFRLNMTFIQEASTQIQKHPE